jgi:rare lipoprotein A
MLFFLTSEIFAAESGKLVQTGTASFYNKKFQGKHTSSGERLDNDRFTAAHSSIPFGTLVKVTNLSNDKSVIVKVNDRFYPKKEHIVDITYSAAKEIDMIRLGMARVRLEVLDITEEEAEAEAVVPTDSITYKIPVGKLDIPAVSRQIPDYLSPPLR